MATPRGSTRIASTEPSHEMVGSPDRAVLLGPLSPSGLAKCPVTRPVARGGGRSNEPRPSLKRLCPISSLRLTARSIRISSCCGCADWGAERCGMAST